MIRTYTLRFAGNLAILPVAMLASISLQAFADSRDCEARSPPNRVAVLELYTSEGCNSCPPADHWVSALAARGFTPDRVIPLAFHVDYWDQLGWPDRMAKAQFSIRQRVQAARNRANFVYTPQLLLNGADYQQAAGDSGFGDRVAAINRLPVVAELRLRQRTAQAHVEVELEMSLARVASAGAQTFFAITENRLQSAIQAGENRGKLLHHDFVVRQLSGPLPQGEAGRVHWKAAVTLGPQWKRPDLSLVAFVQDEHNGEILQAMRVPLCTP
jgi:hypothetical protein